MGLFKNRGRGRRKGWRPERVVVCSGHMIDTPDRVEERFPAVKEEAVRAAMARQLDAWQVDKDTLALCGGARGADLLFAELAAQRGAAVRLLLPFVVERFIQRSVKIEGSDWERRFRKILAASDKDDPDAERPPFEIRFQTEALGELPAGENAYERNNGWMLDMAASEAPSPAALSVLLVWEEKPEGDGAGGTADVARRAADLGATIGVVNPLTIDAFPRDVHLARGGRKRILALDGGGVRGILTLQYLKRLEELLEERHDRKVLLCEYFDLIAGTSTGSIIAAALARGMTAAKIEEKYDALASRVFQRAWYRLGLIGAKFDEDDLRAALHDLLDGLTIGSPELQTGLLIITKRIDTGSQWPISNNPRAPYFHFRPGSSSYPNGEYSLEKIVRASTAAPHYFQPEVIQIDPDRPGSFVDGGVSTANNPTLEAFKLATLSGFGLEWPTGAEELLIVSCGTGTADASVASSRMAAKHAVVALASIMNDCSELVETLMQWISTSDTARKIDSDIGTLAHDQLAGRPLATYQRYNVELDRKWIKKHLDIELSKERVEELAEMDEPANMDDLAKLGAASARHHLLAEHLPPVFDLPGASRDS